MPPKLFPCSYCDRLYTHYSIDLHQPQCLSNPNRKMKLPQLKRTAQTFIGPASSSTSEPLPALLERCSHSVGSSSQNSSTNSSADSTANNENRPATRSINQQALRPPIMKSRPSHPKLHKRQQPPTSQKLDSYSKRICFVCGEKVSLEELMDHEIDCEAEWRTIRREFPVTIRARSPIAMRIPSVDGTVDNSRMDMYAQESAERAQKTRCLRCCRHVPFAHVLQHQCTRFEPTVQFYF